MTSCTDLNGAWFGETHVKQMLLHCFVSRRAEQPGDVPFSWETTLSQTPFEKGLDRFPEGTNKNSHGYSVAKTVDGKHPG